MKTRTFRAEARWTSNKFTRVHRWSRPMLDTRSHLSVGPVRSEKQSVTRVQCYIDQPFPLTAGGPMIKVGATDLD